MVRIYGGSDDLIEIDGEINDEVGVYLRAEKGLLFRTSGGFQGKIKYDGEWKIEIYETGLKPYRYYKSVGDEGKHEGEIADCTSYSDVAIFENIDWIKIGNKKYELDELPR